MLLHYFVIYLFVDQVVELCVIFIGPSSKKDWTTICVEVFAWLVDIKIYPFLGLPIFLSVPKALLLIPNLVVLYLWVPVAITGMRSPCFLLEISKTHDTHDMLSELLLCSKRLKQNWRFTFEFQVVPKSKCWKWQLSLKIPFCNLSCKISKVSEVLWKRSHLENDCTRGGKGKMSPLFLLKIYLPVYIKTGK